MINLLNLKKWLYKEREAEVPKPLCKHYKQPGAKYPDAMSDVIQFDEYRTHAHYSFSVAQCGNCGHRAFSCMHLHCMGMTVTGAIDRFIAYKIELPELIKLFMERDYKYQVEDKYKYLIEEKTGDDKD